MSRNSYQSPIKINEKLSLNLVEICIEYIYANPHVISVYDAENKRVIRIHEWVTLPYLLSQKLFQLWMSNGKKLSKFLELFKNPHQMPVKWIDLDYRSINEEQFLLLMRHYPISFKMKNQVHTKDISSEILNMFGNNLLTLSLRGDSIMKFIHVTNSEFNCLQLRSLTWTHLSDMITNQTINNIITPMTSLTYLDLSFGQVSLRFIENLKSLNTLILYNYYGEKIERDLHHILKVKTIRSLDVSQPFTHQSIMRLNVQAIVDELPNLVTLDISNIDFDELNISSSKLSFFGCLGCDVSSCNLEDYPSLLTTGVETDDAIIRSFNCYRTRANYLLYIMKHEDMNLITRKAKVEIVKAFLNALHTSIDDAMVLSAGTIFVLRERVLETDDLLLYPLRREILETFIKVLERHPRIHDLSRHVLRVFIHFRLQELMLYTDRIIKIIHEILTHSPSNDLHNHHFALLILNHISMSGDGSNKTTIGECGLIEAVLGIIHNQIKFNSNEEILSMCWSALWNLTDETDKNSEIFLKNDGMQTIFSCLKLSSSSNVRKHIMGLLGNVAEVKYLRPNLMTRDFIQFLREYMLSGFAEIEIAYNACGVLSHIFSDGRECWEHLEYNYDDFQSEMISTICNWYLEISRSISYRSFKPIMRLFNEYESPASQLWAVWAISNLMTFDASKYCQLLMDEGGVTLLDELRNNPATLNEVVILANYASELCTNYINHENMIPIPVMFQTPSSPNV